MRDAIVCVCVCEREREKELEWKWKWKGVVLKSSEKRGPVRFVRYLIQIQNPAIFFCLNSLRYPLRL